MGEGVRERQRLSFLRFIQSLILGRATSCLEVRPQKGCGGWGVEGLVMRVADLIQAPEEDHSTSLPCS